MKAVVYKEPYRVAVEDVPDPKIQHPNDVIFKITTSAICGSDLHMYEGRTAAEPAIVLNSLVETVRPTGAIGVPGLYVPADPGGVDEHSSKGKLLIAFGKLFEKGQRVGTGQCSVKRCSCYLRDLIIAGRAKPSFVVSHELKLEEAPGAYEKFDKRIEGYTKVVLHP